MSDKVDAIKLGESRETAWDKVRKYREEKGLVGQSFAQPINIFTAMAQSPVKTGNISQSDNSVFGG